ACPALRGIEQDADDARAVFLGGGDDAVAGAAGGAGLDADRAVVAADERVGVAQIEASAAIHGADGRVVHRGDGAVFGVLQHLLGEAGEVGGGRVLAGMVVAAG